MLLFICWVGFFFFISFLFFSLFPRLYGGFLPRLPMQTSPPVPGGATHTRPLWNQDSYLTSFKYLSGLEAVIKQKGRLIMFLYISVRFYHFIIKSQVQGHWSKWGFKIQSFSIQFLNLLETSKKGLRAGVCWWHLQFTQPVFAFLSVWVYCLLHSSVSLLLSWKRLNQPSCCSIFHPFAWNSPHFPLVLDRYHQQMSVSARAVLGLWSSSAHSVLLSITYVSSIISFVLLEINQVITFGDQFSVPGWHKSHCQTPEVLNCCFQILSAIL